MAVYANELNSKLQENKRKQKEENLKKKSCLCSSIVPSTQPQFSKRNASHQNAWKTITKHMRDIFFKVTFQ